MSPKLRTKLSSPEPVGASGLRSLPGLLLMVGGFLFGARYLAGLTRSVLKPPVAAAGVRLSASSDSFGWLGVIARPLYLALRFLHVHGIPNWGWDIVALTVMFNVVVLWPRIAAMKSSLKMMRLQPQVDAIKERYAHLAIADPARAEMNAEMMALYKAEGANMFGGCLPTLLQMPLLFAYLRVLRGAQELHGAHWLWLRDLSLPDPLHILPMLIIASMVVTQMVTPAPGMTSSQRWAMGVLMPVVMGFSLWHYAAGLSLYWLTGNFIGLLMQVVINRSAMGREIRAQAARRR